MYRSFSQISRMGQMDLSQILSKYSLWAKREIVVLVTPVDKAVEGYRLKYITFGATTITVKTYSGCVVELLSFA